MSTDVSSKPPGDPGQTQIAPEAAAAPPKMTRESVTVITTLLVATFVVILNETIMNVALPPPFSGCRPVLCSPWPS